MKALELAHIVAVPYVSPEGEAFTFEASLEQREALQVRLSLEGRSFLWLTSFTYFSAHFFDAGS